MRLREVKIGTRVQCRRAVDGNERVYLACGKISGLGDGTTLPLVRFDRSVRGHGYKNRKWYCGYRDLQVIP